MADEAPPQEAPPALQAEEVVQQEAPVQQADPYVDIVDVPAPDLFGNYEEKYTTFSNETIQPQDIARALFPTGHVLGPALRPGEAQIDSRTKNVRTSPFRDSVRNCHEQIQAVFNNYGLELCGTTYEQDKILEGHKKAHKNGLPPHQKKNKKLAFCNGIVRNDVTHFAKKHTSTRHRFFCAKCYKVSEPDPANVRYSMILEARLTDVNYPPNNMVGEDEIVVQARMDILKVFPHDCNCQHMSPRDIDISNSNNAGSGLLVIPDFPHQVIFGDVLDRMLQAVEGRDLFTNPAPGEEVGGSPDAEWDTNVVRLQTQVPSQDDFYSGNINYKHWRYANIRLWYWLICKLQVVKECYQKQLDWSGKRVGYYPTWPKPNRVEPPHVKLCQGEFHFGCHEIPPPVGGGDGRAPTVGQGFRTSFGKASVRATGSPNRRKYSVNGNPLLRNKAAKPGTFIIPLQEHVTLRSLVNGAMRQYEVPKGKMVYIGGDTLWAGTTVQHPHGDNILQQWAYHIYWDSILHPGGMGHMRYQNVPNDGSALDNLPNQPPVPHGGGEGA